MGTFLLYCIEAWGSLGSWQSWQVQLKFEDMMAWCVNSQTEAYS